MKKKVVSLGSVLIVISIVAILLNTYRIGEQNEVETLTDQKRKMHTVIANARQREEEYQNDYANYPQPIGVNDIDRIQNTLISNMKAYGLDVVSITQKSRTAMNPATVPNGMPAPPPSGSEKTTQPGLSTGVTYEAVVQGKWDSVMTYLDGLQNGTILCQVQAIRMEAASENELVKTSFSYKIYTE